MAPQLPANTPKNKVVFILGATGTGKTRISVDLATNFPSEIINSDKIQVYKGLDIVSNKAPLPERKGVPHHLLGEIDPDEDFSAFDFCCKAVSALEKIVGAGNVPIIVGGSNSFIEALVEDPTFKFKDSYECCFIWMDVSFPVLDSYVSKRVDKMVELGLVDEVHKFFDVEADYSKCIRTAIGVPEMHDYFLQQAKLEVGSKEAILASSIDKIKEKTCELVRRQYGKIKRLKEKFGWDMYHIDATLVLEKSGDESDIAWNEVVLKPCLKVVLSFLAIDGKKFFN